MNLVTELEVGTNSTNPGDRPHPPEILAEQPSRTHGRPLLFSQRYILMVERSPNGRLLSI